ncbi:hypothetical protein HJC23_008175 [Cyclotella cryptica]|uniref:Uncharacterized protein n=1 Tax=Cyclotella cryptica TaxID=29204 RepID=A0ABD3PLW9_9STRA
MANLSQPWRSARRNANMVRREVRQERVVKDFFALKRPEISQHPLSESSEPKSTKNYLENCYNAALLCSPRSLDEINNIMNSSQSQTVTFHDLLDEGDGKDGDLNWRFRNEQWKTFSKTVYDDRGGESSEPVKKRKCPSHYSTGRWVIARDLVVLCQAASCIQLSTHLSAFGLLEVNLNKMFLLLEELCEILGGTQTVLEMDESTLNTQIL